MKAVLRLFSSIVLLLLLSTFNLFAQEIPEELGQIVNGHLVQPLSPNGTDIINLVLPVAGGGSGNSRAPQGSQRYERTYYLITAAEMQAAGVPAGSQFTSLGFLYSTPQNISTTGTFQVYFMNTSDVTNSLSTTWATAISGMTKVDSSQGTIPAAGIFDKTLSNPTAFTYSGGGLYVAWEYSNPTNTLSTANTASCNTLLTSGLKGGQSTTSMPTTVSSSNYRPATRLGYTMLNDAAVNLVYTMGKLSLSLSTLHVVQALIKNAGDNALSNVVVTLNITGANTFTNSKTISSLASGEAALVSFDAFTPTSLGVDTVNVSVPADGNLLNNVKKMIQTVTEGTFAYSDGSNTINTAYGFGAANSGAFLTKYYVKGSAALNSATCFIYMGTGNTVRGVAYNKEGVLIAQSSDHVLVASDTMHYVTFNFTSSPTITNDSVYVGIWETPSVNFPYYPMGSQAEEPTRYGASYEMWQGVIYDDGGPGGAGKYMIEANFTPQSSGQVYFSEDFTGYTIAGLAGQNGWTKIGYDSVEVANSTPLTYPGYLYGGNEYVKSIVNSATTGRIYHNFTDSLSITTPGSVAYCSMLLKISTSFTTATGYFFSLGQAPGTSNYFAKLFAKNITDSTYYLGVSKSSNTASFVTTPMKTNQTYLVLIRYNGNNTGLNQNSNTCYMWINPTGSSEPDTALADAKVWAGQNDYTSSNISAVIFHNRGTSNPYFSADGIRVAGSLNSSSAAWTALNPGSLPVELTSFTATVSGKSVNLSWRTASEINNRGFFIERKSENSSWTTLNFVSGNGSSLSSHQYYFTDNTVTGGKYSYRLKQVDFNGTASLSSVINVDLTTPVEYTLSQNYPNPFNPSTKISYQLPVDSKVKVELFNITGQKVADLVNNDQSAGSYSLEVNSNILRNIASGVYIYRMTAISKVNGVYFTSSKKMMLMK